MAANLQRLLSKQPPSCPRASDTLLLYNRTASKADALAQQLGARSVASVSELHACTIVCLMLADDTACSCVLEQLLAAGPLQGKVLINHSTTTPDFAKAAEQKVAAGGGVYLSVPVWGRCG
jgi:3-hydroxyisobutyrate dehydrogenase-like beta-hydroxyacid dehydrogenase